METPSRLSFGPQLDVAMMASIVQDLVSSNHTQPLDQFWLERCKELEQLDLHEQAALKELCTRLTRGRTDWLESLRNATW
jgi:vesicle coat complex subunit